MDKKVIGTNAYIGIMGIKAPAKIDTGADSTSVWASNIKMSKDGVLSFTLFDKSSPFYILAKFKKILIIKKVK